MLGGQSRDRIGRQGGKKHFLARESNPGQFKPRKGAGIATKAATVSYPPPENPVCAT